MGQATSTQMAFAMVEKVMPKVPYAAFFEDSIIKYFTGETLSTDIDTEKTMKIPQQMVRSGQFQQSNLDGGDLGPGSGPQVDGSQVTTFDFTTAHQWTLRSEFGTDSKSKAVASIVDIIARDIKNSFNDPIDALAVNSVGNGALDYVISSGSPGAQSILVNNAVSFVPNQTYLLWNEGQTVLRAPITVQASDPTTNVITTQGPLPSGITATDVLTVQMFNGTPPLTPASLNGIFYTLTNSTSGSWQYLPRTSYPTYTKSAYVPGNGNNINHIMIRQLLDKYTLLNGPKSAKDLEGFWGTYQKTGWERNSLNSPGRFRQEVKGDKVPVMLYDTASDVDVAPGLTMHLNMHMPPASVAILKPSEWGLAFSMRFGFVTWQAGTILPVPSGAGSWLASRIQYYGGSFQIWATLPSRAGAFQDGLATSVQ